MVLQFSPGSYLAPVVDWLNINFHPFFAAISYVVEGFLGAIEIALLFFPAYVVIAFVFIVSFYLANWKIAVFSACALALCFFSNLWQASMQTVGLVVVSVTISVLIAFPIGVLAASKPRLERTIRPLLDIMQTVPPWVYLIPAVMLFSLGRVPAIIATIIYGIPPMLRLTALGFKQIPKEYVELGYAIGASPSKILFKIEMPIAMPTLLVGLNQCILLSLSMVVLAGLVGAGGLGAEVTRGLTRMEMGLGLRAGLSVVAIALLLDRLSKAVLTQKQR